MKVISRSEAKLQGLKRFFTGLACPSGHVSERHVGSGVCVECGRERAAVARSSNGGKIRAQKRARYAANPEKFRSEQRLIRETNPERVRANARARRHTDPEKFRAQQRAYRAANRDSVVSRQRAARSLDRERFRNYDRAWNAANPTKLRAKVSRRRASERRAVPGWFGELDELVWLEAADLAGIRASVTGITWNADHMIPLCAEVASGLHTWNNCQVIPATLNAGKRNRMVLTNPFEWIFCS